MARANRLVLNVAELLRKPGTEKEIRLQATAAELDLADDRLEDGPVGVELRLDVLSDGIVVAGTLISAWHGVCRRCLADVGGPLVVPVRELYQMRPTDPEAFPIVEEQLDLAPVIREALLLELPVAPLCRDDCAGLCPVCGGDRNVSPCDCDTSVRDERWSALDTLRPDSR